MKPSKRTLVFWAMALVAGAVSAADLSATQIVEKNVAARGGLAAWRAVQAISFAGDMDAGGKKEMKLPYVFTLARPHKSRLELRFEEQTALQTFDGVQGWKYRPFLGRKEADPLSPAEVQSAAAADELDGPLVDHVRKGIKVELLGREAVEGKNTYKLRLTQKGGATRQLWVDAASFLEVKIEGEPRKLDNRVHAVAVYYRDFKSEAGLVLPHTLETVVEGVKGSHQMSIRTVTKNPPISDSLFAKPQLAFAADAVQ